MTFAKGSTASVFWMQNRINKSMQWSSSGKVQFPKWSKEFLSPLRGLEGTTNIEISNKTVSSKLSTWGLPESLIQNTLGDSWSGSILRPEIENFTLIMSILELENWTINRRTGFLGRWVNIFRFWIKFRWGAYNLTPAISILFPLFSPRKVIFIYFGFWC